MRPPELVDRIRILLTENTDSALREDQARRLAGEYHLSEHEIQSAALSLGAVPLRYLRNQQTYSLADQNRLLNASAAIVGLGGLGGAVLEILSRAGVGRLVLIDGDRFEEHNLNRQLLCTEPRLGSLKAEAAEQRALEINSAIRVEVRPVFLTESNADALIGGCDLALDCLDNIGSRFILEQAARKAGVPMVSAAVAGLTGHVTTIYPQDGGLQLIHGPRESVQRQRGAEAVLGCLPQAVVLTAAVESAEALKILTGRTDELLRNRLWVADLASNTFEVLSLS